MNQIRYFINCTNKPMRLGKSKRKRVYDMNWPENDVARIKTIFAHTIVEIEQFIQQAEQCYESVLIYCNNGQNRSLAVLVCFLMRRFRWDLKKTLGYLEAKRNDLAIKQNYFKCLQMSSCG